MDGHTQLRAALLLTGLLSSALTEDQLIYCVVGGTLVLCPPEASTQRICSILWRHSSELLVEWVEGEADSKFYGTFNGRTTLNTTTGCLELSKATTADSGFYSVEINHRPESACLDAEVMRKVPRPVVQLCPAASESCNLTCAGDATDAGPVSYSWRTGDGAWKESGKSIVITNTEETQRVETFSCRMKNPVSEEESEPRGNPFSRRGRPARGSWCWVRIVVIIMTLLGSVSFVWAVAYLLWRNRSSLTSCVTEKGGVR